MIGNETAHGEVGAFDWRGMNERLRAWHKSGDESDELISGLVALGLVEGERGGLAATDAGTALRLFLHGLAIVPVYDAAAGRLFWRGRAIKTLRGKAVSQRAVLEAFARAGWPRLLDDPLGGCGGEAARRRLRQTVRGLNRSLAADTIRFHAEGRGRVIRWERREG
jgi:hypothetical protein